MAAKCLSIFAHKLGARFGYFVPTLIPVIADRFKEKKPALKEPLCACIDSIIETTVG